MVYFFKGIPNLYSDVKGNFFYEGKPARKVYNNGSLSILCGKTKHGLKKGLLSKKEDFRLFWAKNA